MVQDFPTLQTAAPVHGEAVHMGSSERSSPRWRLPSPRESGDAQPHTPRSSGTGAGHATPGEASAECPWTTFSTRAAGEARDFMTGTYRGQAVRVSGDPDTFEFTVHSRRLDLFRIDVLQHTGHLEMVGGPGDHILVAAVFRGQLEVETAAGRLSMSAGDAVMTTVNEPRQIAWKDLGAVVVQLDALEFRRLAAELAGVDPAAGRLHVEKASRARARQWSAAVRYVITGVLDNPVAAGSMLAQRESFRLLATTALEAFPQPDFSVAGGRDAAATPPPATVRRAVEFIEANAGRDITVSDIAQFARLSCRGLQAAFHRNLNTSPAAYLRSVRLGQAHRELMAADPRSGQSVAEIAERWGFLHPGRFAAVYREQFGVPPSHTLSH
jgi:AraC-like DNA-binding protein